MTTAKRWSLGALLKNRSGNFGMMAAFVLPLLLAGGGVAMDMANMVMRKQELQNGADSAALAAAAAMANKGMSENDAKLLAMQYLSSQSGRDVSSGVDGSNHASDPTQVGSDVKISSKALTGNAKEFTVIVDNYDTVQFNALTALLGQTAKKLHATSTVKASTEAKNALTMYLVLDRSGSMSFVTEQQNAQVNTCDNYTNTSWPDPDRRIGGCGCARCRP